MKIIDLKKEDLLRIQINSNWSFLQSYQWLEIQEKYGQHVVLKSLQIDKKIIGFFVAIEHKICRSKKYWYLPKGPVFLDNQQNLWLDFFLALKKEALKNDLKFIRLEPVVSGFLNYYNTSKDLVKTVNIQPATTSLVSLNFSEEDLLNKMAQKTRYNIKLAQRKGVEFSDVGPEKFDDFWRLMSVTAGRDNFFVHSKNYYKNLIEYNNNFIKLFSASFNGQILAMGIFSFFGSTVSYLHGASSNENRNLMAPYLLHWELIKLAKSKGYKYYDLYGVDEKKWPGVSRFKNGFAGQKISFPGAFDCVVDKRFYLLYKFFRQLRRALKKIF
jgi:peptidoglycan pentaglycine glycine transferase (the first glycine)